MGYTELVHKSKYLNEMARARQEAGICRGDLHKAIGNQAMLQRVKAGPAQHQTSGELIQRHPYDDLLAGWNQVGDWDISAGSNPKLVEIGVLLNQICEEVSQLESEFPDSGTQDLDITKIAGLLKKADTMSKKAGEVLETEPGTALSNKQYEILRSLCKFPHIILPKETKISLDMLPDILSGVLGDEASESEIGLFRSVDRVSHETTGLGLMLGRKAEGRTDVGAYVSSPGESSMGFKNTQTDFLAHTHPIAFVDRAGNAELDADKSAVKDGGMEMVLRSDKESLLLYDSDQAYNKKSGRGRFVDALLPRIKSEVLAAQFDLKSPADGGKAFAELEDAINKEYTDAEAIHEDLKDKKYNVDEYEGKLKTLHEKLLHSAGDGCAYDAVKYLQENYPDNNLVKQKTERQREESSDIFDFPDLSGMVFDSESDS